MNISHRLRTCAKHTGLDSVIELLQEAADEIDALQARAIRALRPERVPMTEDQVWNNDALMSANGIAGFKMDALLRIVRAAEAHHGITAQAKREGA